MTGVQTCALPISPNLKIVVVTPVSDEQLTLDLFRRGAQIPFPASGDDDARALTGQQMSDAIADALARTTDDGTFSRKIEIHVFRLSKKAFALW